MSKSNNDDFISKLDIFGLNYDFLVDGETSIKTRTGAYLSITYIMIVISLFFGFGIDFYKRQNPKVVFNSIQGIYERQYLSNKNYTLAYRVEDNFSLKVNRSSILDLYPSYFYFNFNDTTGKWDFMFQKISANKKCSDLKNVKEKESYYNVSLNDYYCIDFDEFNIIGGRDDGTFFYGIEVLTKQCLNSSSNNNSCDTFENIQDAFISKDTGNAKFFFTFLYLQGVPKMSDYNNPLSTGLVSSSEMLSLQVTKRKTHVYKLIYSLNDNGWIFSDVETKIVPSMGQETKDFNLKNPQTQDILYQTIMYFGKNSDVYTRSYTKIQEVFAQIGGFSNFFYMVIIVSYEFMRKTLKNTIITERIKFAIIKKDNKLNKLSSFELSKKQLFPKNEKKLGDISTQKILETDNRGKNLAVQRDIKTILIDNEENQSVSLIDYAKYYLCEKKMNNIEVTRMNNYLEHKKYIDNVFDVFNVIKFYSEFQYLKKILLNDNQILALKSIKPKCQKGELDEKECQNKIIDYFSELSGMNGINQKLFDLLVEDEGEELQNVEKKHKINNFITH